MKDELLNEKVKLRDIYTALKAAEKMTTIYYGESTEVLDMIYEFSDAFLNVIEHTLRTSDDDLYLYDLYNDYIDGKVR